MEPVLTLIGVEGRCPPNTNNIVLWVRLSKCVYQRRCSKSNQDWRCAYAWHAAALLLICRWIMNLTHETYMIACCCYLYDCSKYHYNQSIINVKYVINIVICLYHITLGQSHFEINAFVDIYALGPTLQGLWFETKNHTYIYLKHSYCCYKI